MVLCLSLTPPNPAICMEIPQRHPVGPILQMEKGILMAAALVLTESVAAWGGWEFHKNGVGGDRGSRKREIGKQQADDRSCKLNTCLCVSVGREEYGNWRAAGEGR